MEAMLPAIRNQGQLLWSGGNLAVYITVYVEVYVPPLAWL